MALWGHDIPFCEAFYAANNALSTVYFLIWEGTTTNKSTPILETVAFKMEFSIFALNRRMFDYVVEMLDFLI